MALSLPPTLEGDSAPLSPKSAEASPQLERFLNDPTESQPLIAVAVSGQTTSTANHIEQAQAAIDWLDAALAQTNHTERARDAINRIDAALMAANRTGSGC